MENKRFSIQFEVPMSEQTEQNSISEIEKFESDREEITAILDQFQQKWGMTNAQIAKEIGISDVSLSYAKNGKRSGKNILAKLQKLSDEYGLNTPENEEDLTRKDSQLQLARQLSQPTVHPALFRSACAFFGFQPHASFVTMLGEEMIVQLALQKKAQQKKFQELMFSPKQLLPLPVSSPVPALPEPHTTVTIIEEPIAETNTSQRYVRFCKSCHNVIKGTIYEVPAQNPTYGYFSDYYCEQCVPQTRR